MGPEAEKRGAFAITAIAYYINIYITMKQRIGTIKAAWYANP